MRPNPPTIFFYFKKNYIFSQNRYIFAMFSGLNRTPGITRFWQDLVISEIRPRNKETLTVLIPFLNGGLGIEPRFDLPPVSNLRQSLNCTERKSKSPVGEDSL